MYDFVLIAFAAGIAVALSAGPLGCFILWRRMAYFGDSLAHSALLGVALGLLGGVGISLGVLFICALFAGLLVIFEHQKRLAMDALLGIFAHGALALGLVALSFTQSVQVDMMSFLVGDILSIQAADLGFIVLVSAIVIGGLAAIWTPLLSLTIHEDLTQAEGHSVLRVRLIFMGLIALFVMAALKVIGVLLISALLIIPAAAARGFGRSPEMMAIIAAVIGCLSVAVGLWLSLVGDTPAGPSIVVAALLFFGVSQVRAAIRR